MRTRRGMTLTEILIALFIFTILSGFVYEVMKETNHKRAMTEARALAQREAGKTLSLLQSDLEQAMLNSFRTPTDESLAIDVHRKDPGSKKPLVYTFTPPAVRRRLDGKEWEVTHWLESMTVSKVPAASGQLVIDLTTKVWKDGLKEDEAQTHTQRQMVVMREDMSAARDPFWRDTASTNTFFDTQGNLLAGIVEDSNLVVENFDATIENLKAQAASALAGSLAKAKTDLLGSLTNIKGQMTDLDTQIRGLDPEGIFDMGGSAGSRIWGSVSGRTSRLKDKAARIKEALASVGKSSDLKWSTISNIAGGDSGRLRGTIKQMFQGKDRLFEAGGQIVKAFDDLKITVSTADGVDRTIWKLIR